ncbi:MAG: PocR ligand-binding domain-containing protein [Treponema sp.]|nr:PocR ligand-binding domain-containing protein [Treponema sp.]
MEEMPYITDLISVEVLQQIQDAFSNMVGMAAVITDSDGHPVTKPTNYSDYCWKYTRKTKRGQARCEQCDKYGALMTHDTGKPTFYTCHSGLIDFTAPIVANGRIIGSFTGGQVLTLPPNKETVKKVADAIHVDFDEYWEAAQKIKVVSQKRINNATQFLYTISSVISDMALGKYNAIKSAADIEKASKEIEKAAQMKTDFLANMSHEIRTPMNAVIGMAEMALREDIPDAARSYIKQIKSSGRALLSIINDILDFSKIESGKMDVIPAEYDSMSLFNDVANIIMTRLVDKEVSFDLDIAPGLPVLLYGDNIRIRQILINLANNAVKFTNQGYVRISVDFEKTGEAQITLKISVTDTGIGIKEEDLSKIFESFQQVDSKRNRNVEGTGLGLTISQRLVYLMNGSISVQSEYGKGSTFSFSLPQTVADWEPAMRVKKTEGKVALGLFTNKNHSGPFLRDCKRLGIPAMNSPKQLNLENYLDAVKIKYGENADFFVFFGEKLIQDDKAKAFIASHPEVTSVFIADFVSETRLDIPNLRIVKKPLSCMNLSMIFNKEKISFAGTIDHDGDADFTAPDARILIVDDNTVNLTVAEGLLEPLKVKTDTAASGREALQKAREIRYDIVLMDHMMPEMDGVEATQKIREMCPEYKDIPIIALTANAVGSAKEMFMKAGMNDFIAKPIEVRVLISKMKQWLPKEKLKKVSVNEKEASQPQEKENPPLLDPALVDLDTASAIKLVGSEKIFLKILKEYYKLIPSKAASIQAHFDAEDWDSYTVEVHALKSSSKQIGAMQLSDMAAALEKAGKAGDTGYIKANSAAALEKYRAYEQILAPYCKEEETNVAEKPEYESKSVREEFEKVRRAALDLDMDGLESACKALSGYRYPPEQAEFLTRLIAAADELDMDSCANIVDEWDEILI